MDRFVFRLKQGWVSSLPTGRNGFLPGRKSFFWEEIPQRYSNLYSIVYKIRCHAPLRLVDTFCWTGLSPTKKGYYYDKILYIITYISHLG